MIHCVEKFFEIKPLFRKRGFVNFRVKRQKYGFSVECKFRKAPVLLHQIKTHTSLTEIDFIVNQ